METAPTQDFALRAHQMIAVVDEFSGGDHAGLVPREEVAEHQETKETVIAALVTAIVLLVILITWIFPWWFVLR